MMSQTLEDLYKKSKCVTVESIDDFIDDVKNASFEDNAELHVMIGLAGAAVSNALKAFFNQTPTRSTDMKSIISYIHAGSSADCPVKLIMFDEMLFPGYEIRFDKIMSPDVFQYLQARAKFILDQEDTSLPPEIKAHLESIVSGCIPFEYRVVS